MKAFMEPLSAMTEYKEIRDSLHKESDAGVPELTGCIDSQKLHMIHCLSEGDYSRLIVTFTEQRAREFCEEYRFLIKMPAIFLQKIFYFISLIFAGMSLRRNGLRF